MSTETAPAPTTREAQAHAIIQKNMLWAGGAGILPLPLFDLAAITGVQLKLVKELADLYEVPFLKNATRTVVISLIGTLTTGTLAGVTAMAALKFLPGVGQFVAALSLPVFSVGVTRAVGRVFVQHFEAGGTILDLDPAAMRNYFREEFEKGTASAKATKPVK